MLKKHQNINQKHHPTKPKNHLQQMTLHKILPVFMHHHHKYQRKQKNVKSKRQHQHHRQIRQLQQKNKKYLQLQSQQHNQYIHFNITHQNILTCVH